MYLDYYAYIMYLCICQSNVLANETHKIWEKYGCLCKPEYTSVADSIVYGIICAVTYVAGNCHIPTSVVTINFG